MLVSPAGPDPDGSRPVPHALGDHFCAPVFVFLAGTGAFLVDKPREDAAATRLVLLTRGLWLVVLDSPWSTSAGS